jgi:hypothetical protein
VIDEVSLSKLSFSNLAPFFSRHFQNKERLETLLKEETKAL